MLLCYEEKDPCRVKRKTKTREYNKMYSITGKTMKLNVKINTIKFCYSTFRIFDLFELFDIYEYLIKLLNLISWHK